MKKFLLLLLIITGLSYGKIGQGLSFDGVNDYVQVNTTGAGTTNTVTLSAWIKLPSLTGYDPIVYEYPNDSKGLAISGAPGNPLAYSWMNSIDEYEAATGLTISTEVWHFIALVITPTAATVYLDGASWTNIKTHTSKNMNVPFYFAYDGGTRYLPGLIDEVRVYNRALSATEVRQVYYGIPTTQYGLVGHWQLLGTSNNFAPDISGKKNHGTLTNGPVRGALSKALKFRR